MSDWDAKLYSKFEKDRTQPSIDLVHSIPSNEAKLIIDIGCGIGNSTMVLKKRYNDARIIGIDSSDDMLIKAKKDYPNFEYIKLDAGKELDTLNDKYDIVFSNACIQWIPDHKSLIPKLFNLLSKNVIQTVVNSTKWCIKFSKPRELFSLLEEEYYDVFAKLTNNFRIWETIYFHTMPSHQSIVEWYKGAGLRPYLEQLSDEDKVSFEADILDEVKKTYPVQKNGDIIFKFPRLFMLACNY
ncbi:Trans-aconitate 2-methyltransferase [Neocallimastix californiae]|uniref:Trans-aconitate 2-methyltransferase n=1 Tax=Neocallimastix californiae TaxID=1754190 RepID=A0A1Y2FTM5_9FUNG|nr:Trans-aconitate 2-methyltransferase [Neocallimastix californiae]|eukprot:ORY87370.1 Trans-aconitate 2-methyltransferase [Neocallimastix californiae]